MLSSDEAARETAAGLIRAAINGDADRGMEMFARLDLPDCPVILLEAVTFAAHAFLQANSFDTGRARDATDRVARRPRP